MTFAKLNIIYTYVTYEMTQSKNIQILVHVAYVFIFI